MGILTNWTGVVEIVVIPYMKPKNAGGKAAINKGFCKKNKDAKQKIVLFY